MSIPNILADALGTFNDPPIVEKPNGGDALRTSSGRAAFYDQLAKMSPAEYARGRDAWAKSLGIPPTALNAEIKTRQKVRAAAFAKAAKAARAAQHALAHWSVQPWPDAVATDALLDALVEAFARYLILPRHAVEGVALWTLHAWTFGAGDISPFLALTSPTKRCGKTSLLILLYWLTPKSELAANISATAIFRYIDFERPTLLIDEADSFLEGNEEMRGVLNSGHTKAAAYVIRNVEIDGEHRPQRFSTWAPKAIATIGNLPGTLEDRSIIVRMQRKPKGAKVSRCRRHDCPGDSQILRSPGAALGDRQSRKSSVGYACSPRGAQRSGGRQLGTTARHRRAGRRRVDAASACCRLGAVGRRGRGRRRPWCRAPQGHLCGVRRERPGRGFHQDVNRVVGRR